MRPLRRGVTRTNMVAVLPEEVMKPVIATIPLGRVEEPEEVANAGLRFDVRMLVYLHKI